MSPEPSPIAGLDAPRPIPESYWILPGRLLAGAHPGSRSRAAAMERLRAFLGAGFTCFIDLTEPSELPSYEALLPFETPEGRRVEYLREPIPDHDIPSSPACMTRVLSMLDAALSTGHVVYLHCRGGVGRSSMAAGCWLAARDGSGEQALARLQELWQYSVLAGTWLSIPETPEQVEYVRTWTGRVGVAADFPDRARAALLGLALGEAMATARSAGRERADTWGQQTSLALCLAESLLARGGFDARDQMGRYLRWWHEGHLTPDGRPAEPSRDVGKALATYEWRGQPMAGSHDPTDLTTGSLSRVVAAVLFGGTDSTKALTLAGECSRTTHQSPVVIDACRYFAALLLGALSGVDRMRVLDGVFEPEPGAWSLRPLRNEVIDVARAGRAPAKHKGPSDVLTVLGDAIEALRRGGGFEELLQAPARSGDDPALRGAVAGALAGAFMGTAGLPSARLAELGQREMLMDFAARLVARRTGAGLAQTRDGSD